MRYGLIVTGVVAEIIESDDIEKQFHPDFVKSLIAVNDSVQVGMVDKGGIFEFEKITENPIDKIAEQYAAIDAHISKTIKQMPYDYDSPAEIPLWIDDVDYGLEARSIGAWCRECHKIQARIAAGELVFDSVEQAIAALPVFELL